MKTQLKQVKLLAAAYTRITRMPTHECNLCGRTSKFHPYGDPPRVGALCPRCGSLERHRLLGLWLARNPVSGMEVLHFSPEPVVAKMLKKSARSYISADLDPNRLEIDRVLNIEAIDLSDNSFNAVVCSHVLEHVNDEKALSEIYRVLVPGGKAILMVPIIEGWDTTFEDPTINTPQDRRKFYGQSDHVRWFGRDFRDRVRAAGFQLEEFTAEEPEVSRYKLTRGMKVFVGTKP